MVDRVYEDRRLQEATNLLQDIITEIEQELTHGISDTQQVNSTQRLKRIRKELKSLNWI